MPGPVQVGSDLGSAPLGGSLGTVLEPGGGIASGDSTGLED